MTEPTTEKLSRRQRLAEVVLTNAPMPRRISFIDPDRPGEAGDKLALRFDSHAEVAMWAAMFLPDVHIYTSNDGYDAMFSSVSGEWGGHPLSLYARWPVSPPPGPLGPDRRAQLLAIANAPGEVDCCPDAPDAEP